MAFVGDGTPPRRIEASADAAMPPTAGLHGRHRLSALGISPGGRLEIQRGVHSGSYCLTRASMLVLAQRADASRDVGEAPADVALGAVGRAGATLVIIVALGARRRETPLRGKTGRCHSGPPTH